jgi:hypothetical protein
VAPLRILTIALTPSPTAPELQIVLEHVQV